MSQNIYQYRNNNLGIKLSLETNDMSLSSDEKDFNMESVFSPYLIAQTYGNRLPVYFDINNPISSQNLTLTYKSYNTNNVLVSQNYYNKEDLDLSCFSSSTSCDIGLTGIDNGLVSGMTGQSITFTNGLLDDNDKFDRLSFDRRLKLFQVTGYTSTPNVRFSGLNENILYEVVSKSGTEGKYHDLYGGFYQGFYKLFGYDYDILPERMNKGWSVELLLKPRLTDEYTPSSGETTLNQIYPENKNTFFYLGTRAENKFHHHASGSPENYSGYTRTTENLSTLETCSCGLTGITNSRCISVYPPSSNEQDPHVNYGCNTCGCTGCSCDSEETIKCGWECIQHNNGEITSIENTCESDPLFDSMSNALSFKLSGDPKNPSICLRVLLITGGCETTGTCTTGITYTTGYTINEYCTEPIYGRCENENPEWLNNEHWFQFNAVWERYTYLDDCDLRYRGGLDSITKNSTLESLANNSQILITPLYNHSGATPAETIDLINLNEKWLNSKEYRNGRLKIYINGKLFHTFENIEEIIPRGLSTDKERQVGVPFNISWGGGTQGLIENLTFSSSTQLDGPYIQDPECLSNDILSGTTLSGLSTNILINKYFSGSFEGGISQFRLYISPLTASEVKHNFKILNNQFNMFNPDCPDCSTSTCYENDFTYEIIDTITINELPELNSSILGRVFIPDERDNKYLIKDNFDKLLELSSSRPRYYNRRPVKIKPTPSKTPKPTPSKTPSPTPTPTPTPLITSKYWGDNEWWGNQGNTPMCVGYSWAHWIEDEPVVHVGTPPIVSPSLIYYEAQKVDEWYGENYNGTSVRGGAKFLKSQNIINSYYWAYDINTLINTIMLIGPVVVGTYWYSNMFYPDRTGLIRATGSIVGGHAYVINGVDKNKKLFRIKNSWGRTWGIQGRAYISFNDMSKLISMNGEICLAVENNF